MNIKKWIVKRKFYIVIRYFLSLLEFFQILFRSIGKKKKKTVYCISPYKTGTTYLSNLFDVNGYLSMHEPHQHLSIVLRDSSWFLGIRNKALNLDLECSGFFASSLTAISKLDDIRFILIYREFFSWAKSIINHQTYLTTQQGYPYTLRLVTDHICKFKSESFVDLSEKQKDEYVLNLYKFWISFYENKIFTTNETLIVDIGSIDKSIKKINAFLGFRFKNNFEGYKREAKYSIDFDFDKYFSELRTRYKFRIPNINKI